MYRTQFLRSVGSLVGVLAVVIACLPAPAKGEDTTPLTEAEICDQLHVDRFDLLTLDLPEDGSQSIVTRVTLDGFEYRMLLDPYSARSPDFQVLVVGADGNLTEAAVPAVRTYRGVLAERPDARIAATLSDGKLTALIVCTDDMWGIQPVAGTDPVTHAVYRLEDLRPIEGTCGTDLLEHPEGAEDFGLQPVEQGGREDGSRGCSKMAEIAFDADYEFYQLNGGSVSNTISDIESILNGMEVIYDRDTDIVYELVTVIVRDSEPDPYSTTDPGALLEQFGNEWRTNQSGVVRDLAHLMTGKNLDGTTIGVSWLGGVCSTQSGYALSQSRFTSNYVQRVGLTAHEAGHNWNALHCDGDSDCYIMCSMLGGCAGDLTRFGSRSVNRIASFRDTRPCLDDDGPVILTQPTPFQHVCAGDLVALSITVDTLLPQYQWRRGTTDLVDDGVHIFGATTGTLFIVDVGLADQGDDYNCLVTDPISTCTTTSDYAEILVETNVPVITGQPQDQTVPEGDLAFFSVMVQDSFLMFYQWRKDGADLSDGGRFYGCTTNTLMISPVEEADEGEYDCVVTSQLGINCSVISDAATLTVDPAGNDCPEDLNGDEHIGLEDLATLLSNYGQSGMGPEDGDLDGDGTVGLSDLAQLLAVYGQDCPTQ